MVWEAISNTRESVSSDMQILRSWFKKKHPAAPRFFKPLLSICIWYITYANDDKWQDWLTAAIFPQAYSYNFTSNGCTPCLCNTNGSSSLQCNNSGICHCKNNTLGKKCDLCEWGFFGLPNAECQGKLWRCRNNCYCCCYCYHQLNL